MIKKGVLCFYIFEEQERELSSLEVSLSNIKRTAVILFFCLSGTLSAESPDNEELAAKKPGTHSELDAGLGLSTSIMADTVYAYLYKVPLLGRLRLEYSHTKGIMNHQVGLSGGIGRLFSPYESTPGYPALDDLTFLMEAYYTPRFRFFHSGGISLYAGPGIHLYGSGWIPDSSDVDVLRYAWSIHTGLGASFFLNYNLKNDRQINLSLYIPVFGALWRPPYSGYTLREENLLETEGMLSAIFANPLFASFHNLLSFTIRFSYELPLSRLIALKFEYSTLFEYISVPRERMEFQNNVSTAVSFRF